MKKTYTSPKAEISAFVTENPITASGTNNLTSASGKVFTVNDYDHDWTKKQSN